MANEESRARAGATLMDVECIGWPTKIDAERLDLGCCFDCVFGQAFDDHYLNVRSKLGLTVQQCADLGFCSEVQVEIPLAAYTRLSPEAKAVIRERVTAEYTLLHAAWIVERDLRLEEARIEALPEATYASPL